MTCTGFLHVACFLLAVASTAIIAKPSPDYFCTLRFNGKPWNSSVTRFYRHTLEQPEGYLFDIDEYYYDYNDRPITELLTHGYRGSVDDLKSITYEFLHYKHYSNVLTFDWGDIADNVEVTAAAAAICLGKYRVAPFVAQLKKKYNVLSAKIHLLGHNMGAHLMGSAARTVEVLRVTGMDPSRIYFESSSAIKLPRLGVSDANFIDILHTNAGGMGLDEVIGHLDFYPNGGRLQPYCDESPYYYCNSRMALRYFAESIHSYESFYGRKCLYYIDFLENRCHEEPVVISGERSDNHTQGKFFYKTNTNYPFGKGKAGADPYN